MGLILWIRKTPGKEDPALERPQSRLSGPISTFKEVETLRTHGWRQKCRIVYTILKESRKIRRSTIQDNTKDNNKNQTKPNYWKGHVCVKFITSFWVSSSVCLKPWGSNVTERQVLNRTFYDLLGLRQKSRLIKTVRGKRSLFQDFYRSLLFRIYLYFEWMTRTEENS